VYGLRMRRHIVDAVQSAGDPTVSVRCTSEARVGPWVARRPCVPMYPRSARACNGKRDGEYAAFGLRTRRHILGILKDLSLMVSVRYASEARAGPLGRPPSPSAQ
jgi:hypothetical protein